MPTELKQAVIRPLLKKPSLDYQEFKNFRPISNLTFLSKVIEKVVALQLVDYIDNNGLCEVFQSAYLAHHSTETALLRVYNDIAMSIDNQKSVVLVLLDLSAAFDTVDHSLLLARLSTRFGICDQALDWFVHIYLIALSMSESKMSLLMCMLYLMVYLRVPCWAPYCILCTLPP